MTSLYFIKTKSQKQPFRSKSIVILGFRSVSHLLTLTIKAIFHLINYYHYWSLSHLTKPAQMSFYHLYFSMCYSPTPTFPSIIISHLIYSFISPTSNFKAQTANKKYSKSRYQNKLLKRYTLSPIAQLNIEKIGSEPQKTSNNINKRHGSNKNLNNMFVKTFNFFCSNLITKYLILNINNRLQIKASIQSSETQNRTIQTLEK